MAFLVFQCLSQLLSLNYYHAKHCYYSRNFSTFKTIFERLGNSLTFEKKSVFRLETVHSFRKSVAQVKQKNWQKKIDVGAWQGTLGLRRLTPKVLHCALK